MNKLAFLEGYLAKTAEQSSEDARAVRQAQDVVRNLAQGRATLGNKHFDMIPGATFFLDRKRREALAEKYPGMSLHDILGRAKNIPGTVFGATQVDDAGNPVLS